MTTEEKIQKLQELFKKLLKLNPTNSNLLTLATSIRPLQKAALFRLWEQGVSKNELAFLMTELPSSDEIGLMVKKMWDAREKRAEPIRKLIEEMQRLVEEKK
jgi:hypothetical protein